MIRVLLSLAALAIAVPVRSGVLFATYDGHWPETWLDRWDAVPNGLRFASGSITGATMFLVEDARVTREIGERLVCRFDHHFESGLIERLKDEADAWRGRYGLFSLEHRTAGPLHLGLLLLPTYDKRRMAAGASVAYRDPARGHVALTVAQAWLARNVQAWYDSPEHTRRYAIPWTALHLEGAIREGPFSLGVEGLWEREAYAWWGSAGAGVRDSRSFLARARARWEAADSFVLRVRFEGEDARAYGELGADAKLFRWLVRAHAGYGFWRLRQSDFFTDTFRCFVAEMDLLRDLPGGTRLGFGYGRDEPLSGWEGRARSPLPVQRVLWWVAKPYWLNHIRLVGEWYVADDLSIYAFLTLEDQYFRPADIAFWGRLLRLQAQFTF